MSKVLENAKNMKKEIEVVLKSLPQFKKELALLSYEVRNEDIRSTLLKYEFDGKYHAIADQDGISMKDLDDSFLYEIEFNENINSIFAYSPTSDCSTDIKLETLIRGLVFIPYEDFNKIAELILIDEIEQAEELKSELIRKYK